MTQQANPIRLRKAAHEASTAPRHPANPYVGPRPFTSDEKDRFFGREQEASQLIPLIIAEHLVLFYAQSGAGKSSLINARLIPGLVERNFKVLTGRVSGQSAEGEQADNIFTYNLLLSCERSTERKQAEGAEDLSGLAHMTLAEYLANLDIEAPAGSGNGANGNAGPQKIFIDAPQTIGGVQPLALIIDQFEEIITTNPGAWSQRGPFFQQLCDAMEADPYLWVVLAIREDYIAALDPYADLLPGKLRARFYMQRMGYEAGLDAVCLPVQNIRPFDNEAAKELVKNLSLINTGKDQNNSPVYQPGQYIEPVQLQVVCYQLWEELRTRPGESITKEDLLNLAKGKDLAQFISTALANYYVESVHEMIRKFPEISERRLREWFSRELITETETRGAVRQGQDTTGSTNDALPNVVVRMLQDRFIIRAEIRGGNTWYELSHDRFVTPILLSNREWLEKNSRPVEQAAQAYFSGDKDPSQLYEGRQLQEALALLRDHPDDISEKAQKFIQLSQEAAEKRQKRRQRTLFAFYALLLVVLLGLTLFSINQSNRATANAVVAGQQKDTAEAASTLANQQRVTALAAEILAYNQRNLAETASAQEAVLRQTAEVARGTAEAAKSQAIDAKQQAVQDRDAAINAKVEAQAARNQAQGARLSSLSDFFSENQLDLSLLLAIQALKISGTWDAHRALLNGIQHGLENQASRIGFPWHVDSKPAGIAISPDGAMLAVSSLSRIDLWNIQGHGRVMTLPSTFVADYPMDSVSFDSTGTLLARGGGDGLVSVLDLKTGQVKEFHPFQYAFTNVLAVAFQPGGDLLAAGTEKDPISQKGLLLLYNVKTGLKEWSGDCGVYSCGVLAWSPDGTRLAVGSKDGSLQVLDAVKKNILMSARIHKAEVTGLAWYPDGQRLISGGIDQSLIQLDPVNQKILNQTNYQNTPIIMSLALSPDGRFILAGMNGKGGWVGLWDAESLEKLDHYKLAGHSQPVSAAAFNPQGNLFVTASLDNSILLWKFEPVDPLGKLVINLNGGKVEGVFLDGQNKLNFTRAAGGNNVETINEDAVLQLANPTDKPASTLLKLKAAHSSLVNANLNGKPVYVFGEGDGQVSFVDPSSGSEARKALKVSSGSLRSLAVSGDGKLLAAAACTSSQSCSEVSLWDLTTDHPAALKGNFSSLNLGIVTSLAISPDNQTLALGNDAGQIFFYDIATGSASQAVTEGLSLKSVNLVVTSLAFSPQADNLLAAGFHDGRVALWEAASHGPIGEFTERMNGEVSALLFRRAGSSGLLSLVSVSSPGEVREWSVDENVWVARACQMAGRNLTAEEKAKFLLPGSPQVDYCK